MTEELFDTNVASRLVSPGSDPLLGGCFSRIRSFTRLRRGRRGRQGECCGGRGGPLILDVVYRRYKDAVNMLECGEAVSAFRVRLGPE